MKTTVKLALTAAIVAIMGASAGYAANVQPLNPPPADVNDPLYAAPLAAFLPTGGQPPNPAILAIWNSAKASVMPGMAASKPLMPNIAPIVGGNVMAHVMTVMMTSLSDPANPTGIPTKVAPF